MSTALASRNRTELQELALAGAARLEGKAADEIVEWRSASSASGSA